MMVGSRSNTVASSATATATATGHDDDNKANNNKNSSNNSSSGGIGNTTSIHSTTAGGNVIVGSAGNVFLRGTVKDSRTRTSITVLVLGDEGVGKSSLISTFVSRHFSEVVPGIMTRVRLPPDPENSCITTIVDSQGGDAALMSAVAAMNHQIHHHSATSSTRSSPPSILMTSTSAGTSSAGSPTSAGGLNGTGGIENVDSIILVYDLDREETFFRMENHWLPLIERCYNGGLPVIVAGNKMDLFLPSGTAAGGVTDEQVLARSRQQIVTLMQRFRFIRQCIKCSAKNLLRVDEVFLKAQQAVLYPFNPLYNLEIGQLSDDCQRALTRIFRMYDIDHDGLLSHYELDRFQHETFHVPVYERDLAGWKKVLSRNNPNDEVVKDGKFTVTGFLAIFDVFISQNRLDVPWQALRKFGYDDELNLHIPANVLFVSSTTATTSSTKGKSSGTSSTSAGTTTTAALTAPSTGDATGSGSVLSAAGKMYLGGNSGSNVSGIPSKSTSMGDRITSGGSTGGGVGGKKLPFSSSFTGPGATTTTTTTPFATLSNNNNSMPLFLLPSSDYYDSWSLTPLARKFLIDIFHQFDSNHDGILSVDDIRTIFSIIPEPSLPPWHPIRSRELFAMNHTTTTAANNIATGGWCFSMPRMPSSFTTVSSTDDEPSTPSPKSATAVGVAGNISAGVTSTILEESVGGGGLGGDVSLDEKTKNAATATDAAAAAADENDDNLNDDTDLAPSLSASGITIMSGESFPSVDISSISKDISAKNAVMKPLTYHDWMGLWYNISSISPPLARAELYRLGHVEVAQYYNHTSAAAAMTAIPVAGNTTNAATSSGGRRRRGGGGGGGGSGKRRNNTTNNNTTVKHEYIPDSLLPSREIRALLLGSPGCGKTSLINALCGTQYQYSHYQQVQQQQSQQQSQQQQPPHYPYTSTTDPTYTSKTKSPETSNTYIRMKRKNNNNKAGNNINNNNNNNNDTTKTRKKKMDESDVDEYFIVHLIITEVPEMFMEGEENNNNNTTKATKTTTTSAAATQRRQEQEQQQQQNQEILSHMISNNGCDLVILAFDSTNRNSLSYAKHLEKTLLLSSSSSSSSSSNDTNENDKNKNTIVDDHDERLNNISRVYVATKSDLKDKTTKTKSTKTKSTKTTTTTTTTTASPAEGTIETKGGEGNTTTTATTTTTTDNDDIDIDDDDDDIDYELQPPTVIEEAEIHCRELDLEPPLITSANETMLNAEGDIGENYRQYALDHLVRCCGGTSNTGTTTNGSGTAIDLFTMYGITKLRSKPHEAKKRLEAQRRRNRKMIWFGVGVSVAVVVVGYLWTRVTSSTSADDNSKNNGSGGGSGGENDDRTADRFGWFRSLLASGRRFVVGDGNATSSSNTPTTATTTTTTSTTSSSSSSTTTTSPTTATITTSTTTSPAIGASGGGTTTTVEGMTTVMTDRGSATTAAAAAAAIGGGGGSGSGTTSTTTKDTSFE